MNLIAIILLCVAASVSYGVAHDQVTARLCIEYFTLGHPPIFDTADPTLRGLGWGVIATWWVGAALGMPVAIAARTGRRPKWTARRLVRPLLVLLACLACFATLAGLVGHAAATRGWVRLDSDLEHRLPPDRRVGFITDLWSHLASYLGGAIGGLLLCAWTWRRRGVASQVSA